VPETRWQNLYGGNWKEEGFMVCETWQAQLDSYLDGELLSEQMRALDTHVRSCASCATDILARVQVKRAVQVAGRRYVPSAEFRRQVLGRITPTPMAVILVSGLAVTYREYNRAGQDRTVYGELTDLHVATLASLSPVDVVSTDRHTVEPWFEGKIPFTFDLPELHNSEFSLLGGRVTYLGQTPGAHLIYALRRHQISVFILPERAFPGEREERSRIVKELSFHVETWNHAGLWYCLVGDVSATDMDNLAELLKGAGS
jgi:anti-sigma factor RsiW